jgi:hypothetical protein
MPLPLAIPLAISAAQAGVGLYQSIRSGKQRKDALSELKNNPMTIPEGATRSVEIMGKLAQNTRLPQQDIMEERIAGGTANTIAGARSAATSPSQVLAATVDAYQQQQQQNQQLDLQAANGYRQAQTAYAGAVASLAPYQQQAYQNNVLFPAMAKLNMSGQQGQDGMRNIGQGIQSGLSVYANDQYNKSLRTQAGAFNTPPMQSSVPPPVSAPSYWNGGSADNSIMQRQGNLFH